MKILSYSFILSLNIKDFRRKIVLENGLENYPRFHWIFLVLT